ncbi:uncharacterized protein LOC121955874 [Plectropomus leopardus]|uniref:uncharacterized protein LOC121955874 n=1 Tax=Plectropomus leopardus TaxID=160734 RepID=UPI001C4C139C|nr:uncharacterized protein LOC121955874 [Plectropomus leopardus]
MITFRWIYMFLFLILVLRFTVTVQNPTPYAARVGVAVSLPCKGLRDYQCSSITWIFSHSGRSITLHEHGKILEAKSGQLSVGSNCSLNIKMVTLEDAGRYTCRQFRSGQQHGEDTVYDISVVNGEDTITATPKQMTIKTTKAPTTMTKTTTAWTHTTATAVNCPTAKQDWWLRLTIVSVGLAALIIIVVAVNMWMRNKEKKTQMEEIAVRYDEDDGTVNYENITPSDRV